MLFSSVFALTAIIGVFCARPALALDQDDRQSLSRHGEASVEAFAKFGDVGETLTHISSGKFSGTGSQRREMSRRLDAALEPWKKASASARNSLSYKVLPHAFTVADEGMSMLGAAIEGDYRGVMGTAVSVAVEPSATAAGASVIGAIGTGAGMVVGSFIPVVGTAGGAMVGGAIGTVAGGYICSVAYDIYIKEWVGKGVEGGIAGVFDVAPQQQAMRTRHEFLYAQAADDLKPHWDRLRAAGFGSGGVELIGPESTPYISIPQPPLPDPQQQAALPPASVGDLLAGVKKIAFDGPTTCTIDNGQVNCSQPPANIGSAVRVISRSLSGVVAGNSLELELRDVFEAKDAKCTVRTVYRGHNQVVLEAGGRALFKTSMTMDVSGNCGKPISRSDNYSGVGTWRVLE